MAKISSVVQHQLESIGFRDEDENATKRPREWDICDTLEFIVKSFRFIYQIFNINEISTISSYLVF